MRKIKFTKSGLKHKFHDLKDSSVNSMIYKSYYNDSIDDKLVYLESRDGLDFTGNIFRITEELSKDEYSDLKINVHAKPHVKEQIMQLQKNYDLRIDKIITKEATATRVLEKAKYIFTDSGIRPKYVKRQGQVFINTWHGTPLKLMGVDNTFEEHRLGNVQHPFLSSDYLIYPNDYMMDKMINSYMVEKIYPGKILLEGYPRNTVFFYESWLRKDLNLSDYEIFVYMPTYRGVLMDRNEDGQKNDVENYLSELDVRLNDNQILFVKLHVLNESKIDFDKFSHIRPFPKGYEIYDILNMSDVLITDYSSVFFDYANTRRKIILFNYDEKDYESYRGFYFPLSDLPFPKVQNIEDLVRELNTPKNYDDTEFIKKFCQYDNPDACKNICKHIFKTQNESKEVTVENSKNNILIYAGSLKHTPKRLLLFDLLDSVDKSKYNVFITFRQWDEYINENHVELFEMIPKGVEILPLRFNLTPTIEEKRDYDKFFHDEGDFTDLLLKLYKRSFEKQFGFVEFDWVIDFDGSHNDESLIMLSSAFNSAVFVHDEKLENTHVLKEIYSKADKICVVSSKLIKPVFDIVNEMDNIYVIKNLNDILN